MAATSLRQARPLAGLALREVVLSAAINNALSPAF